MDEPTPDWTPQPDFDDPRTPFQRLEDFTRRLVAVPRREVDELAARGASSCRVRVAKCGGRRAGLEACDPVFAAFG